MTGTLKEQLENRLTDLYKYKDKSTKGIINNILFSRSYIDDSPIDRALDDINYIIKLSAKNPLELHLYQSQEKPSANVYFRLFQWQKSVSLAELVPILEHFGLRPECERPYKISIGDDLIVWISDFTLSYELEEFEVDKVRHLFHEAFSKVYYGLSENDGFNKLVLGATLSSQEIMILRALAKYLHQIEFRYGQHYIEKALINNRSIAMDLVELFKTRHNPNLTENREAQQETIEREIIVKLDQVLSLDEDIIISRLLDLIKSSLRTNYFQLNSDKSSKEYLAIKFNSAAVPEMPLPAPMFEIFVYSHTFEGIHLRKDKIARGGIRWSERREDFRREILGLMKAQVVKNTVIVPSGAKGGFVLKTVPAVATREVVQGLVVQSYKLFISALLDLTDNIKGGTMLPPKNVVCHDAADPYLVVAADKGTATFSDIANGLSRDYDFWLGDAFASGGSAGYDHKKMGITARGSWESIKRHFRELRWDIDKQDITVVGIGDMSGDVFGNGMLYSKHLKLIAAFDHRHIFIDPNPIPEVSYFERERLFNLPTSSWEDYDSKLISKGGGIYKRSLKSIPLSSEVQQVLGVTDKILTPNEFICVLLKAPVDLLFNGGIGTYVKSSQETHIDAGDRSNDYCRVNGNELRCKVVGEGGNMGFTQRGRVEYAANGGLINTDFIDNSAGVDCSDHEVNLKILLETEINRGNLAPDKRNDLLASLTEEIAHLVLNDNQNQALIMSISASSANKNLVLHSEYIKELETLGLINRAVEFLPSDKALADRKAAGLGLTRPELAILLAYTKIFVKQEVLKSNIPEDGYMNKIIETAFPYSIRKTYYSAMREHQLKREIIATQLSNKVINEMGITFIYRMQRETGASVDEIIRAYTIASETFGTEEIVQLIDSLDFKISLTDQFEMLRNIRKLINLSTRWFLRGDYFQDDLQSVIDHYSKNTKLVGALVPELMSGATRNYLDSLTAQFIKADIPHEMAQRIATYRAIYSLLNIIEVATKNKLDLVKTAKIYFACGERMNLVWFRDEINSDTREDHWHALTRLTLRDELDALQQALTIAISLVDEGEADVKMLIDKWVNLNQRTVKRWDRFLSILHAHVTIEYSMFFIAIRELTGLLQKKGPNVLP